MPTPNDNTLLPQTKNLLGQQCGRLTVIAFAGYQPRGMPPKWRAYWDCSCLCGTTKTIEASRFTTHRIKSCGCLQRERSAACHMTHNLSHTREWRIWCGIKNRCRNPRDFAYLNYGDRGIDIYQAWFDSFANFLLEVGFAPSSKHSIERINNNIGYEPGNCRWALRKEQARNTRQNHWITYNDTTKCLHDWAQDMGLRISTLHRRIKDGWPLEIALTTPSRSGNRIISPKLQESEIPVIRSMQGKKTAFQVASIFHVSDTLIYGIWNNKFYKHVPLESGQKNINKNQMLRRGSSHPSSKLTEEDVMIIKSLQGTHTQKQVAKKFFVSKTTIKLIWQGKTWKHVT